MPRPVRKRVLPRLVPSLDNGIGVIAVYGNALEKILTGNSELLHKIRSLIGVGATCIILDLGHVRRMEIMGLGVIIRCRTLITSLNEKEEKRPAEDRHCHVSFKLAAIPQSLRDLLITIDQTDSFEIHRTVQQARASCAKF